MSSVWDHPEWVALSAAVCASPDDDLPRLVAADWLDEHGDEVECKNCDGKGHMTNPFGSCPCCGGETQLKGHEVIRKFGTGRVSNGAVERAEFIRTQVELAKWPENHQVELRQPRGQNPPDDERFADLVSKSHRLYRQHHADWFAGIRPVILSNLIECQAPVALVRRGFIATVRCRFAEWTGEMCWKCNGRKYSQVGNGWKAICTICQGSGWIAGIGQAILAAHPVQHVIAADVTIHPARFSGSNDGYIECPEEDAEGWMVPWDAWQAVIPVDHPNRWKNLSRTQALAAKAFSDAMIAAVKPESAEVPA